MAEADLTRQAVRGPKARGEWQPDSLPKPSPLFTWPIKLVPILKMLFGHDGLLWPKNAIYMGIAVIAWLFFTPDLSRTGTFAVGWIAEIYLRNAALLLVIAGGLHLRLYVKRAQEQRYKFNPRWLMSDSRAFLFGNQTRDNIFWNFASGVTIWTAYEAVTLWAYSNAIIPSVSWARHPVYCVFMMVFILLLRQAHFYWTHRLTHWKPLYKAAHYLHHKNVNIGPWSGLSMHPIEHLLYFSGVLLHWIIPSHPLHAIFHLVHTGLSPAAGHAGFYKFEINDKHVMSNGGYFHYLHHRYFDCNYGNEGVPLDKWFGSFHDGSPEAHKAMRQAQAGNRRVASAARSGGPGRSPQPRVAAAPRSSPAPTPGWAARSPSCCWRPAPR